MLLALTYWPANFFLLVFVALGPWLWSLRLPEANWKRSGALFGGLFFSFHMAWLFPFVGSWTGSYGLAAIPWVVSVALQIPYFMLLAFLVRRAYERQWNWAIPFIWASVEFLRSAIPVLAFPHALIATPLAVTPEIIQTAALGTVFFVSAWVVLINVVVVELFERANPRSTLAMAGIALGLGLFSFSRYNSPPVGEKKVITIGQLGTDLAFGNPATEPMRIAGIVPELNEQAYQQGADLLVLPEGLGPAGSDPENPNWPFSKPDLPVLFGMQRAEGEHMHQSAFGFDGTWHHVDKTHLVIFGEYVPFRQQLAALGGFKLPSGDLQPGQKIDVMTLNKMRVAPLLCFEGMFYDVAIRQADLGAQLLAVMSIDDWYMNSGMPDQLWAGSVFRSVENGLPLVRSASLGYSGWVDARGNVRARMPLGKQGTIRAEITLPPHSDAFSGRAWFPWLAVLMALGVWIFGQVKSQDRKTENLRS